MAIHSLRRLVSCFILSCLPFDVSFVVAAAALVPAQTSTSPTPAIPPPSASPTGAPAAGPPPPYVATSYQQLPGGVPSGVRSAVNGKPSPSPRCITTECVAVYPSVDVFYWPLGAPNTACLSTVTDQPSFTPHPTSMSQPLSMISPSIYVVYPPVTIYDLCGNPADPPPGPRLWTTKSYALNQLSTLQAIPSGTPVPQVFNSGDLPCPPPGIAAQLDPGSAYNPVLVSPEHGIVHPIPDSDQTLVCNISAIPDPPRQVVRVKSITGPGFGPPP